MPFIIFVEGLLVVSCMLYCYSIGFGRSLLTIRLSRCAPLRYIAISTRSRYMAVSIHSRKYTEPVHTRKYTMQKRP